MKDNLTSKNPVWKDILEIICSAIGIYIIISLFFITSTVNQTSMYPTFEDGDFIVATRGYLSDNTYERGDIILFKDDTDRVLIKRVIGLPGDYVEIKEGKVYINNRELDESYLNDDVWTAPEMDMSIHDNCYFVLGDNRTNSIDSRTIGEINGDKIIGKVRLRVFPNTGLF